MSFDYQRIMELAQGYQASHILMAACELDLFTAIIRQGKPVTVEELATILQADRRALAVLLAALTALGFLTNSDSGFQVDASSAVWLDSRSAETVVPMICHQASCARGWSQLAWTVRSGSPAPVVSGIEGPLGDYRHFILGMNSIGKRLAGPVADRLQAAGLLSFRHLLDLGGASGTYTLAFLERCPEARATIFDLPAAIKEAHNKLVDSPLAPRITLTEGDFYRDEFPSEVDFVWISAIIHQQDEAATAQMFRKAFDCMLSGGRIAIRDIYFNEDRTGPRAAALFAVNMLSRTWHGRVYTRDEVGQLLSDAGFRQPRLALPAEDMSAVMVAERP